MTKHLDKIQKLIALADNPNINEAKVAALKAVKLMVKHELVPGASPARIDVQQLKLDVNLLRAALATLKSSNRSKDQRIKTLESELRLARKSLRDARTRTSSKVAQPVMDAPVMMASKFAGTCSHCKGRIEEGERIAWKKGDYTRHERCHEEVSHA